MNAHPLPWIALGLCLLVGPAVAEAPPAASASSTAAKITEQEADRRVARLAEELKSPFCPGKTLMSCTSFQAYKLRKDMREMALQGLSDPEIVVELKIRYGDDVQNPPQPWYTFFVPLLPYVLGALLVVVVIRQWVRRGGDQPEEADGAAEDPETVARLARLRARVADLEDD